MKGVSNYPGRPHALTIWETRDSVFEGLRFVQSQMWYVSFPFPIPQIQVSRKNKGEGLRGDVGRLGEVERLIWE